MSYTASHGALSSKPFSPSTGVPTDGRTYYEDAANFFWRPFQNTTEVLAFLDTTTKRTGHQSIVINSGGTLVTGQSGFAAFTGGTYSEYWFKNGVADNNLVPKLPNFFADPTFTGTVIIPTVATNDNSTKAASTAYVQSVFNNVTGGGSVPTGGSTGQVLKKASNTNFDTVWGIDNTGSGGGSAYENVYVCPNLVNDGSSTAFTGTDNSPIIQAAVDHCISNKIMKLFIPSGTYLLNSPIVVRGNSSYCTLDIVGEDRRFNSGALTQLVANFNDAPILCIHLHKGSVISGLQFWGKFQSPPSTAADKEAYFSTAFDSWGSGARDSQHSPHCGIAIDPFTNQSSNTIIDPYPSLTSQYGLNRIGTGSGSTAVRITDCTFTGFVVAIASSVNGYTRNQEECIIERCFFINCKVCVSGGQDQEKNNLIRECTCWGGHTFFCTGKYGGNRMAGHWTIDHVNIAGAMIQFIDNDQHGYFPTHIRNIFCESMLQFGKLYTELTSDVLEFHADFDDPLFYMGYQSVIDVAGNVNFRSCTFRYYDGKPDTLIINGGNYYDCYFGGSPIDIRKYGTAQFYNCVENFNDEVSELPMQLGATKNNILTDSTAKLGYNRYGNFTLIDPYNNKTLSYNDYLTYIPLLVDNTTKSITVTKGAPSSNANPTFNFTTTSPTSFKQYGMVAVSPTTNIYDSIAWARVDNVIGNTVTTDYTTHTLANGSYYIIPLYLNEVKVVFTGDITSSTTIGNLSIVWGASLADAIGMCYKTSAGIFKIVSYSGGIFTIVGTLPATQTGYTFK